MALRVLRKFSNGVNGVLPLGCLPLWGRKGVTLVTLSERIDCPGFFSNVIR